MEYLCGMKEEIKIDMTTEAFAFYDSLDDKEKLQFSKAFNIVKMGIMRNDSFKKLTADIWEFRAKSMGNIYRLFAFWDKERRSFIVCTHGFQKKTQKTPVREIKRAEAIMKEYYKNK